MSFVSRIHSKALFASVSIAAVLSGIHVLIGWRSSRALASVDPTAFVLQQHVLWGLGTVLATGATVFVLLALAAGAEAVPSPWRWPFRFAIYILSPGVGVLITALIHGLLTLRPAENAALTFVTPDRLTATLPAALGVAALFFAWKPRPKSQGPA